MTQVKKAAVLLMPLVMLIFAMILALAALSCNVMAINQDSAAEQLSAIGMFRGTANGYELDRAPKRSEAAIMLVRLYGAEEKAAEQYEEGGIVSPFTDVSPYTTPYVAWLYSNGITKGTSATTFNASAPCTVRNYIAFLLRALGYQDGEDFQYADALSFAESKGIDSSGMSDETFTRGDLAVLTWQALGADMKDGDTFLLNNLIQSGAVEDTQAVRNLVVELEKVRVAGGGMNQETIQSDGTANMEAIRERSLVNGKYPTNAAGKTYGPIGLIDGVKPDLIAVRATNGKSGYVLSEDRDKCMDGGGTCTVYDLEGNVIGEFIIE